MGVDVASVSVPRQSVAQEVLVEATYVRPEGDGNKAPSAKKLPEQELPDRAINDSIYLNGWI